MYTRGSLHCGDVNDIIYDTGAACEGQYESTQGLIWVNVRAHMGSCEGAVWALIHKQ